MASARVVLAACVLACSCSDAASVPFAEPRGDAGASHESGGQQELDASASEHDAALADAGACAPGTPETYLPPCVDAAVAPTAVVLPAIEPAPRTPETRSEVSCVEVPGVAGFYTPASLFVIGERVYVFSVDSTDVSPVLLMHVSPLDALAFEAPVPFVYGARGVDLIAEGSTLRALGSRRFYTVERVSSDDGATWSDAAPVGPHQPTYDCEGYPPPRYFRGPEPPQLLAVGNDYNTGIFGCYERVFVSRRTQDGWLEPVEIGRGDVSFAYQNAEHALIVTSFGALRSDDGGANWSELSGLDALGGVFTGERVMLARSVPNAIAALGSDDDGASWSSQQRVLDVAGSGGVAIAADGAMLSIAAFHAAQLWLSTSTDSGATWSEPKGVQRPGTSQLLGLAQHGAATLWLTSGVEDALELCVLR